jgi:hypothetical protein
MNTALRYSHDASREFLREPERGFQINSEGAQIARIHPDQIASRIHGALQLFSVMDFTQDIQSTPPRTSRQRT